MKKETLTYQINCGIDRFWKVYLSEDFTKDLYLKGLGYNSVEIKSQSGAPGEAGYTRELHTAQDLDAPGAVKAVMGSEASQTEDGKFDGDTWRFSIIPDKMSNKIHMSGVTTLAENSDGGVTQTVKLEYQAKIFGIGGMIETLMAKMIKDGYDGTAVYMNKWLADDA